MPKGFPCVHRPQGPERKEGGVGRAGGAVIAALGSGNSTNGRGTSWEWACLLVLLCWGGRLGLRPQLQVDGMDSGVGGGGPRNLPTAPHGRLCLSERPGDPCRDPGPWRAAFECLPEGFVLGHPSWAPLSGSGSQPWAGTKPGSPSGLCRARAEGRSGARGAGSFLLSPSSLDQGTSKFTAC